MNDLHVLVLAAGGSTRMGRPKVLLPWHKGQNVLEHQLSVLKELKLPIHVVLGSHYEEITSNTDLAGISILRNTSWEKGQGSSVASGVAFICDAHSSTSGILISLVDQPLIDVHHYQKLVSAFQMDSSCIIASSNQAIPFSAPAVFPKIHFPELLKLNGAIGAKRIIKSNQSNLRLIDGGGMLEDIDTFEGYERVLGRV